MKPIIAIPATAALVLRAYTRNSLTGPGILLATFTALAHALHPSSLPFTLLCTFFLLGTAATKVKHDVKATLTVSASGAAGGEGPRHAVQVLANSGVASVLCLVYAARYGVGGEGVCFGQGGLADVLMLGVLANYAAVTADTLSSELGILSKGWPRLVTTLRTVPPGTNGGVSLAGVLAGAGGAAVIGLVSVLMLDICDRSAGTSTDGVVQGKVGLWVAITVWGTLGSLLDSLLGAVLQASVVDKRTGKVVEGAGGKKVLVTGTSSGVHAAAKKDSSRSIGSGRDVLDNNQINILMALIMSVGGMAVGGRLIS